MRLIDADALMELYELGEELKNYEKVLSVPVPVIQQNIKDMPTINAVEVVRCKDCEYYEMDECGNPYIWMSDGAHLYMQPDDFCSYGKRRGNDGNL